MNQRKLKIIKDIEKSVPQEWRDALIKEQYVAPDLREAVVNELAGAQEAINALTGPERIQLATYYQRLQNIFDSGYYDVKEKVVDEEIAKKIEDFVEAGIQAAIDAGQLPKKDSELQKYAKKIKRNVKRTTKPGVCTPPTA